MGKLTSIEIPIMVYRVTADNFNACKDFVFMGGIFQRCVKKISYGQHAFCDKGNSRQGDIYNLNRGD